LKFLSPKCPFGARKSNIVGDSLNYLSNFILALPQGWLHECIAMPTIVCPTCQVELEIPGETPSGKTLRCSECREKFPYSAPKPKPKPLAKKPVQVVEVIEDDDEPPRKKTSKKKKKKRKKPEPKPFWKTRHGKILNGLGLIGLGVAGIAIYFLSDTRKMGIVIAGGLCILFGLGAIGTGFAGGESDDSSDDNSSSSSDDDF
jgi:hypothetical protein